MTTLPELASIAPFRATTLGWRAPHGAMATLVCKATYRLAPTESPLAEEQEYPYEDDNHWNDDPSRSLHAPTDMVPLKPRAEVLVVGSAFSASKQTKRRLVARIIVGEVDKAVQVSGDRFWKPDGTLSEPVPFVKMPLRYERASGGPGTSNPVGVRWDYSDSMGKTALPNLLPLDYEPGLARDMIDPVGFGPISPTWPLRAARLGRQAEAWVRRGSFDEPMPEDFDATYFLAAPWDQQLEALRPNERIVLENLHPDHPRLVTSLPGIEPRVFVERVSGSPHELALRCDTLWIDTDRAICTLCWRGQVPLEPEAPRRIVVASARLGQRLAWAEVEPLLGRPVLGTAAAMRLERGPRPEEGYDGPASARPPSEPESVDTEPSYTDDDDDGTAVGLPVGTTTSPFLKAVKVPALPFVRPQPGAPPAPPASVRGLESAPDLEAFGASARARAAAHSVVPEMPVGATIELDTKSLPDAANTVARDLGRSVSARNAPRIAPAARGSSPAWLPEKRPTREVPPVVGGAPASPPSPAPSRPPAPPASSPIAVAAPPALGVQPVGAPPAPPAMVFGQAVLAAPSAPTPQPDGSPWATGVARPKREGWGRPRADSNLGGDDETGPIAIPLAAAAGAAVRASFNAVAASNAAAAQAAPAEAKAKPKAAPREAPVAEAREVRPATFVDLLWFDPEVAPRARASSAFKELFASVEKATTWRKPGEEPAAASKEPVEVRARRDVLRVVTGAAPVEADKLRRALDDAFSDPLTFAWPLVLVAGELAPSFDDLEVLKATVQIGGTLAGAEKRLRDAVALAAEGLKTDYAQTPDGSAALLRIVHDAFGVGRGTPTTLETAVLRTVLEGRKYKRKSLVGAARLRADLTLASGAQPIPVYLPEAIERSLPLLPRFKVRLLGELRAQEDHAESHPEAIVALAVGRVLKG